MLVKFRQDKVRRTPPGLEERYFVEFRTMTRSERDRALALMFSGDPAGLAGHILECTVSDFLLPSDRGDIRFGEAEENAQVYEALDAELAEWMVRQGLELNGLLPEQLKRREAVLGNSEKPSGG
ncbi:MAG: hypothetical protein H5T86_10645 [Armatimonadetes bacterium]|nr:hypothetical protein [Armatimonadota bacterium]